MDDLPGPVVTFLNVIGVPWPHLNEDDVRQFATLVREFGQAVQQTHLEATEAVSGFARAYRGTATRRMQSGWEQLSERHVQELVSGCHVLADALDLGAEVILAQKVEALAELAGLAAAFIADQAAAVATAGLSEAAVPVLVETGRKLLETLKQQIIEYITGQIVDAVAKPLFAKIDAAVSGLDWSRTSGDGVAMDGFSIDPAAAKAHLQSLRCHAEAFRAHARTLLGGLEGLAF